MREDKKAASPLCFCSHQETTCPLHFLFQASLLNGDCSTSSGSGSPYCSEIFRNCRNQLFLLEFDRTSLPCCWRMQFGSNLAIIPSTPSCQRCSNAKPGRLPERKNTTQSGVVEGSFWKRQIVTLWYLFITPISFSVNTKAASPEKSTGQPYSFCN